MFPQKYADISIEMYISLRMNIVVNFRQRKFKFRQATMSVLNFVLEICFTYIHFHEELYNGYAKQLLSFEKQSQCSAQIEYQTRRKQPFVP